MEPRFKHKKFNLRVKAVGQFSIYCMPETRKEKTHLDDKKKKYK